MTTGERALNTIADVAAALDLRRRDLPPGRQGQREFLGAYARTTRAVGRAATHGMFEDPGWVVAWDVAFARLYLDALDADQSGQPTVPRPWRLAFNAPQDLPPLRHLLLGINAHINYDLPQSLLAVMPDPEFDDPSILTRRRRDHERIDEVLASRVAPEHDELSTHQAGTLLDRALQPLNRRASRRFLREAREKVWHNTLELQRARVTGADAYGARLAELEILSAARVAELMAPGQVLLRLAVAGFGVAVPPLA